MRSLWQTPDRYDVPRPSALDPRVQHSLRHSMRDAAAFSVMSGAGESYLAAFALYLKATPQQIAWLASIPPLIGSWMQLVSAWFGQREGRRKALIVGGALAQALCWLPLALLPLVFTEYAATLLIGCGVLYHAMGNLIQPQWGSLMGDLVPERRRGRYFARRNRLASLVTLVALACAGIVLDASDEWGAISIGFLTVFSVAILARLISAYHLARMYDPEQHNPSAPALRSDFNLCAGLRALRGSPFLTFSLFVATMQGTVAIASPFFAVYMLHDLKFSYLQFMINTAAATLMHLLTLNAWGRISDALGNRLVLVTTGWIIPLLPALWVVSGNFWYLLAIQFLAGLAWGGFNLSTGNYLYDLRPGRPLSAYMAAHNVLTSAAVFAGAALGGYLAGHLPREATVFGYHMQWEYAVLGVFLCSTVARLGAAALFLWRLKEVRVTRRTSVGKLIFRMARFNPVSGVVMDIIGTVRTRAVATDQLQRRRVWRPRSLQNWW
jgi:Arabinose efflux permease